MFYKRFNLNKEGVKEGDNMGRHIKTGLDYFPLDVSLEDEVELLEAECGIDGFAVIVKLWQKIYANGYYIDWEEDNALLFSRKINYDINKLNVVVSVALRRNIFNKSLHKQHNVLTSKGIQKRYIKACSDSRRKNIAIFKDYYLLENTEYTALITEFMTKNVKNDVENSQSRVDKSRVEEYIVEDSDTEPEDLGELILDFSIDSKEYKLSKLLYDLILLRNPKHKEPKLQSWSKHIDLMIRIDKRDVDEIEHIIKWSQKDEFWQDNILSTNKLRKQYDQLYLKAIKNNPRFKAKSKGNTLKGVTNVD